MALDPEQDPPQALPNTTPQGTSSDASQPNVLSQMWDEWHASPENRAAMMNFGLALMQPISPGQSRTGHFAQAVGYGLEGGGAAATKEEERQRADEAQALKEREEARREQETEYYGQGMGAKTGTNPMALARAKLGQQLRDQSKRNQSFTDWLTDKGGAYATGDPMFKEVQRAFPKIVSKADLQNPANVDARRYAQQLHDKNYVPERTLEEELVAAGIGGGGQQLGAGGGVLPPPGLPPGARPVYEGENQVGYTINGRLVRTDL